MDRLSKLPFEEIDAELRSIMREYDDELGGSEFVRVFAHAPNLFKSFIKFYFPLVSQDVGAIDIRLTELVRLKVAERNDCNL